MPIIIDGKKLAARIKADLAKETATLKKKGVEPGMAVIIVGEDQSSRIYVKNKRLACETVGISSFDFDLPESTSQEEIETLIKKLNSDRKVHAILVQLPLPKHINEQKIIELIEPAKDVDGFHPVNVGKLTSGFDCPRPCTALAVIRLIDSINCPIEGKHAVVVGRSNIVGKPTALLLLQRNATVTICHSKTKDLPDIVKSADILVVAIGSPKFIKGDWLKENSVVIDVGINRAGGGMVGDVDFESSLTRVHAITPVPGGVGPMTIAMLLKNTVEAAKSPLTPL